MHTCIPSLAFFLKNIFNLFVAGRELQCAGSLHKCPQWLSWKLNPGLPRAWQGSNPLLHPRVHISSKLDSGEEPGLEHRLYHVSQVSRGAMLTCPGFFIWRLHHKNILVEHLDVGEEQVLQPGVAERISHRVFYSLAPQRWPGVSRGMSAVPFWRPPSS